MKNFILMFALLGVMAQTNAQNFDKEALAHIEASALATTGTYFVVSSLGGDPMQKILISIGVAEAVGIGKELIDMSKANNRFSFDDILYNQGGIFGSILLIEGLKALGVPENYALGILLSVEVVSFGLTVNF